MHDVWEDVGTTEDGISLEPSCRAAVVSAGDVLDFQANCMRPPNRSLIRPLVSCHMKP